MTVKYMQEIGRTYPNCGYGSGFNTGSLVYRELLEEGFSPGVEIISIQSNMMSCIYIVNRMQCHFKINNQRVLKIILI